MDHPIEYGASLIEDNIYNNNNKKKKLKRRAVSTTENGVKSEATQNSRIQVGMKYRA